MGPGVVQRGVATEGQTDQAAATLKSFTATAGSGADLAFAQYQQPPDVSLVTDVRDFASGAMNGLDALSADAQAGLRPELARPATGPSETDQPARVRCVD